MPFPKRTREGVTAYEFVRVDRSGSSYRARASLQHGSRDS